MNNNVRKVIILSILYHAINCEFVHATHSFWTNAELPYKYEDVDKALGNMKYVLHIGLCRTDDHMTTVFIPVNRGVEMRLFEEIYTTLKGESRK